MLANLGGDSPPELAPVLESFLVASELEGRKAVQRNALLTMAGLVDAGLQGELNKALADALKGMPTMLDAQFREVPGPFFVPPNEVTKARAGRREIVLLANAVEPGGEVSTAVEEVLDAAPLPSGAGEDRAQVSRALDAQDEALIRIATALERRLGT